MGKCSMTYGKQGRDFHGVIFSGTCAVTPHQSIIRYLMNRLVGVTNWLTLLRNWVVGEGLGEQSRVHVLISSKRIV